MSLHPEALEALARKLRDLAKAQRDSLRAADRSAAYTGPRRGLRGAKKTTLEARWSTLAEHRDRLLAEAQREAVAALGIRAVDLPGDAQATLAALRVLRAAVTPYESDPALDKAKAIADAAFVLAEGGAK